MPYKYEAAHNCSHLNNRVYVCGMITSREVSSMVPCTTTPRHTIQNGCHTTGECERGSIKPLPASSFTAYLRKKCEQEKWMYQHITFGDHLQAIVISLQRGNLRAVCDNSFDDGYGSAAWCIDSDGDTIRGVDKVPVVSDTLMQHGAKLLEYTQSCVL